MRTEDIQKEKRILNKDKHKKSTVEVPLSAADSGTDKAAVGSACLEFDLEVESDSVMNTVTTSASLSSECSSSASISSFSSALSHPPSTSSSATPSGSILNSASFPPGTTLVDDNDEDSFDALAEELFVSLFLKLLSHYRLSLLCLSGGY